MKLCISLKIKEIYNPLHKINVIPHSGKKHYRFKTSASEAGTVGQAFYRIKHFCPWYSKITVTKGEEHTQGFKSPSVTSIHIDLRIELLQVILQVVLYGKIGYSLDSLDVLLVQKKSVENVYSLFYINW